MLYGLIRDGGIEMPNWDWERRRSYLSVEALKKAVMTIAGYIEQFGNDYGPNKYQTLRNLLVQNTGLDFAPNRLGYISIFRNYKRLYSSLDLFTHENDKIILLPTGEWIAENDPSHSEISEEIISSFSYPNPAFQSFDDWTISGKSLTPMQLIIRCLSALGIADPQNAFVTPSEIAHVLYEADDSLDDVKLSDAIINYRNAHPAPTEIPLYNPNEDEVRQVREILSFMEELGVASKAGARVQDNSQFTLSKITTPTNQIRTNPTRRLATQRRTQTQRQPVERLEFIEGAIFHENRRSRKRNTQIREHALTRYGCVCAVCRFDYSIYGDMGRSAVDVHHLNPIADRTGNEITTLDDVCVLCATCHRMIHTGGELKTPEQLRQIIEQLQRQT